ncbi:MAG TPA: class I SAM-dependent methyltransferase [Candidatus Dormibacteraeota bacterium]|nr:class I SAM-dependent methyltransferase [Candidatus Dormibacteraeota bacterium]
MTTPPGPASPPRQRIVDYDGGFDYCAFWGNRDYEHWVEARTLRRLLPRLGRASWFADFGGGFGRNAIHYRGVADHVILVDYSVIQLTRATERLAPEIMAGQVTLIRADLAQLPLVDSAVDAAMVVRVLHHMSDADKCLTEMARTVGRRWLVDVPIKHHALARLRSVRSGSSAQVRGPEPVVTGSTQYPFYTFQLAAIRDCLRRAGFRSHAAASVNNFRRWDQVLPTGLVNGLRPAVYSMELAVQRLGRGWWGPSQFLLATRSRAQACRLLPTARTTPSALIELARRTRCPGCHSELSWTLAAASCRTCGRRYPFRGGFWDFSLSEGRESV